VWQHQFPLHHPRRGCQRVPPFQQQTDENSSVNSWELELFIRQCQRATYFVDAALDTTFIANIANYFGKALNCKPHWIRNKYIRPSNRSKHYMRYSRWLFSWKVLWWRPRSSNCRPFLEEVTEWWSAHQTKSFTETLGRSHWNHETKRILIYNSSGWYIPRMSTTYGFTTICSFTVRDGCVLYRTPFRFFGCVSGELAIHSQWLVLQQLFRVRNLKGEMHIHVHKRPNVKLYTQSKT
jgi:hypothetical protein